MSAKLKTVTLGCKVNQYETEFVREGLARVGYADAAPGELADLCIVNTCTVTNEGDSKSRQVIRRLARDNPHSRIVVMGCYATRAPEDVEKLPNVVEVVTDKRELPDLLARFGVIDIPTGISRFGNRRRAYVKVQDGCLLRCSYCVIPQVRPQMTSRPVAEILAEVRRLVNNGYREIVLTGVHLGHYGVDWNANKPKSEWTRLADLVRLIIECAGEFRVRLSSIEATEVTRELLEIMADNPHRVCPHLHICMQSGSDAVLRRMKRRWGVKRFLDRCRLAKEMLDTPALTTDAIVGFPGETPADFAATCDVAREVGFSKMHIFPFSARRGTPAASMDGRVPKSVASQRREQLQELEAGLRSDYFDSLVGRRLEVLVEETLVDEEGAGPPMIAKGTACRYVPVQMVRPAADESRIADGNLLGVNILRQSDGCLVGSATRE